MSNWNRPLSDDERERLNAAYVVLTKLGNETADGETWDRYLDRAHHYLGLILALDYAHTRHQPCGHSLPEGWSLYCPICAAGGTHD